MITIFGIGFAQPLLFLGVLAIPVLWWLARIMPPPPAVVSFPAARLLAGLHSTEIDSRKSPWWLIILRTLVIVFLVLALTRPIINPAMVLDSDAPVVIVVENSWSAAADWTDRRLTMQAILSAAELSGASVRIISTAAAPDGGGVASVGPGTAYAITAELDQIQPRAWDSDPIETRLFLEAQNIPGDAQIFWLADSVTQPEEAALLSHLEQYGTFTAYDGPIGTFFLSYPEITAHGLSLEVSRSKAQLPQTTTVILAGETGQVLGQQILSYGIGETMQTVTFDVPSTLRNAIQRIYIAGHESIGSTLILDQSWRRKSVGLLTRGADVDENPLLSGQYYVSRALSPFADVSITTLMPLMDSNVAAIVEASGSRFDARETELLSDWVTQGGVLIRFSSQRLALEKSDQLLPVALRTSGRLLGSTLAWEKPIAMSPFETTGVFAGLTAPEDVRIKQQILADAQLDSAPHTWAQLQDGTPLVTGKKMGDGWLVLFHVSANTEWSNLPLSGIFPQMLQRLVDLATISAPTELDHLLVPVRGFDAFGNAQAPTPIAQAIDQAALATLTLSPETAPGLYLQGDARKALNLSAFSPDLSYKRPDYPLGSLKPYRQTVELDLMGPLLTAALILYVLEMALASLSRRFNFGPSGQTAPTVKAIGALLFTGATSLAVLLPTPGHAMSKQEKILAAVQNTHLAYVITGDAAVDEISLQGLRGLSHILARRTSVEPMEPIGIDVTEDELQVWPLLYWPITPDFPSLSDDTISRLNVFLRTGGTILFDTRDELIRQATGARMIDTQNGQRLARLLNRLDVPPLSPVPGDHVLSRTFYLLQEFPGRYSGGHVWIEIRDVSDYDGVSGLVIGSHDWAAAWAVDDNLQNPIAIVPGGEAQREQAYRFGVNMVMYVLTGNYKSDQVHIPVILERLGH